MYRKDALGNIATNHASGIDRPPRVHIYSDAMAPEPNTHGAGLTICSQVQAFLDLGFEVEFVYFRTRNNIPSSPGYFKQLNCTVVDAREEKLPQYARVAYWAGWPRELALRKFFPARKLILREAKARIKNDGNAIHVFHYLRTANVIMDFPSACMIWACHEIESEFHARNYVTDQKREKRQSYRWESRQLRRLSVLEREVARSSGLVLCVASEDAKQIVEEWKVPHAAYLPMSIPYGETTIVSGESRKLGELRLMHIGYLEHLPTYTSLEFLFSKVFPLLDTDTLSRLKLEVAGISVADGARTKAIMEMARPYPLVRFSGFVEDIRTAYRRNDLQVVASTQATGVRTRIVESWAFGLPVLCTTVGAGGVNDLAPGQNILIADDPRDFARNLQELLHNPERLDQIAVAARQTYEAKHSRPAVAAALRELLNTHFGLRLPSVDTTEVGVY
jgi:glycosyltransferase involved in cell wall biosynthesis